MRATPNLRVAKTHRRASEMRTTHYDQTAVGSSQSLRHRLAVEHANIARSQSAVVQYLFDRAQRFAGNVLENADVGHGCSTVVELPYHDGFGLEQDAEALYHRLLNHLAQAHHVGGPITVGDDGESVVL